jgi:hypothetical protein
MRLPRPSFEDSSRSLEELSDTNRREEKARGRLLDEFSLDELFLNLSSKDSISKARVRAALPAHGDRELVAVTLRLVNDAAARYPTFCMQWQRKTIGYLTSIGAEAMSRLGSLGIEVPEGLDFVGLEAEGDSSRHALIRARKIGDFAGVKARFLDFRADSIGDFALRKAECCNVQVRAAGHRLGEDGSDITLRAREAGDWLMLRSRRCFVDARQVGSLAGLDSNGLEIHVNRAGTELCERAMNVVIHLHRGARSLGTRGSGVIYIRRGSPSWRTCFRVEKMR